MVVTNITWHHEVVYSSTGKPVTYKDLSVPVFVHGYLIVMATVDTKSRDIIAQHLEDLMSDCDLYRWEKVRAYHGVLLNQMEQGCLSWEYSEQKVKFHQALLWHSATSPPVPSSAQPALSYTSSGTRKLHKTAADYNAPTGQAPVRCSTGEAVTRGESIQTSSMCAPTAW